MFRGFVLQFEFLLSICRVSILNFTDSFRGMCEAQLTFHCAIEDKRHRRTRRNRRRPLLSDKRQIPLKIDTVSETKP